MPPFLVKVIKITLIVKVLLFLSVSIPCHLGPNRRGVRVSRGPATTTSNMEFTARYPEFNPALTWAIVKGKPHPELTHTLALASIFLF